MATKKKTEIETPIASDMELEVDTTTATPVEPDGSVTISRSREWMQGKYPEEEWVDDAAYEEKLATHLADTDERLAMYEDANDIVGDLMERNPNFAMVIAAMRKGMSFEAALRRYCGDLFNTTPDENDPDWEALKKASDDFLAEKKKADDEIATRNSNLEKSDIVLKEFVERNFATEQEQIDFVEYLRQMLRNLHMGELSEEFFTMALKAYKHDTDVEDAKEAGAIEARNQKITAKRIKEASETDGIPTGGGSSPIVEESEEEEADDSIVGKALRSYQRREKF
jgi:hypothetical protein